MKTFLSIIFLFDNPMFTIISVEKYIILFAKNKKNYIFATVKK